MSPAKEQTIIIPNGNMKEEMKENKYEGDTENDIEISYPIEDLLRTDMDPIEIGESIAEFPQDVREEYIENLRKLAYENEGIPMDVFFKTTLLAIKNSNKALQYWEEELNSNDLDEPVTDGAKVIFRGDDDVLRNNPSGEFNNDARWSDLVHDTKETTAVTGQKLTKNFGTIKKSFDETLSQKMKNDKDTIRNGLNAVTNSFVNVGNGNDKRYEKKV